MTHDAFSKSQSRSIITAESFQKNIYRRTLRLLLVISVVIQATASTSGAGADPNPPDYDDFVYDAVTTALNEAVSIDIEVVGIHTTATCDDSCAEENRICVAAETVSNRRGDIPYNFTGLRGGFGGGINCSTIIGHNYNGNDYVFRCKCVTEPTGYEVWDFAARQTLTQIAESEQVFSVSGNTCRETCNDLGLKCIHQERITNHTTANIVRAGYLEEVDSRVTHGLNLNVADRHT